MFISALQLVEIDVPFVRRTDASSTRFGAWHSTGARKKNAISVQVDRSVYE
jgi:hypothetical protein